MSEEFVQRHEFLEVLMQECIDCFEHYPVDFFPFKLEQGQLVEDVDEDTASQETGDQDGSLPSDAKGADQEDENEFMAVVSSLKKMSELSSPKIDKETLHARLKQLTAEWPPEMFPIFLECSRILSSALLEVAHYHPELAMDHASRRFETNRGDDFMARLFAATSGVAAPDQDPFAEAVLWPCCSAPTPNWLFTPVSGDVSKLQPHEVSRVNWIMRAPWDALDKLDKTDALGLNLGVSFFICLENI